jgi:hypothetical protein
MTHGGSPGSARRPEARRPLTSRSIVGRGLLLAVIAGSLLAAFCSAALANAPNPTSVVVDSVTKSGSNTTVTISGTWTWDKRVPSGAQIDCNDSRIGVGYSVIWGDNTVNPLKVQKSTEIVYVGDALDNWVHSVTEGRQTVDGPFKPTPHTVEEAMLGETPEHFGMQGISTGATTAIPTKADAEKWVSNCGPTQQSTVNGQLIGNSNPSDPTHGYPNGTWGPISHTYTTPGPHKICPVMYDPHGSHVGLAAGSAKEIIAGGSGHNGDNSIESNGNKSACVVSVEPQEPSFTIEKAQKISGSGKPFTKETLTGKVGENVDYEIIVENTGTTSLTFNPLSDSGCENIEPSGTVTLAKGASKTYLCEHVLNSADQAAGFHENCATATGTPPGEPSITHTSNCVVVNVPPPPGKAKIYLGYVDEGSGHASPSGHPTPWNGENGVSFAGCGFTGTDTCAKTGTGKDIYDAGAIRIEAPSTESITVTGAKVTIGPCTYEPWPGLGRTIPAGGNLILTQTGQTPRCLTQTGTEVSNFDTSESFLKSKQYEEFKAGGSKLGTCKNDGFIPQITLTINGQTTTVSDTGQILNSAGIDPDICTGKGEMQNWVLIQ